MALPSSAGTPGRKSLRKIQVALESTPGTEATSGFKVLRVPGGVLSDDRQVTMVEEMVGIIPGTDRSYIAAATSSISIDSSPITPQQWPVLMAAALGFDQTYGVGPITRATPTTGELDNATAGAGVGYRYTTTFPTTSAPYYNNAYTFQAGDDFEQEIMTYGKCTGLSVGGSSQGPITMQGSFIGQYTRPKSPVGFTSAALVNPVEDLIFARSALYLDDVSATPFTPTPPATTYPAVLATFLGFDISIECSWVPKFTGQGSTATATSVPTWEFALWTRYAVSGSFTIEHNNWSSGLNNGLKQKWRDQTTLMMRIDCIGSQSLSTTGSTLTPAAPLFPTGTANTSFTGVRFEMPIKITQVSPLSDNDGNDIVTVSWVGRYNSTYAGAGYTTTANSTSVLF